MNKPSKRWWGYARRIIRDYPGLKKQWDDLHRQSVTADISGMPRGGGAGRVVETVALLQLPANDQHEFDAVRRAIEATSLLDDGNIRISMIRYVYWQKKRHKIKDAALLVHVSQRTAERWHSEFVCLVGYYLGYEVGGLTQKKYARIVESEE